MLANGSLSLLEEFGSVWIANSSVIQLKQSRLAYNEQNHSSDQLDLEVVHLFDTSWASKNVLATVVA